MFAPLMRWIRWSPGLAVCAWAVVTMAGQDDPAKKADRGEDSPPVQLSAQEDHLRLMELLKIKELRRGANGNDRSAPNAAIYDEAKATPFPNLLETALVDGEVAFRQHGGGHTTGTNWPTFLAFADRYFKTGAADETDKR